MNISISSNLAEQISKLAAVDIERATEKALDRSAEVVRNIKTREINKTYARPIPKGKNGKPKWKRRGDFLADQTIQSSVGERIIGGVGNSEKYERRLANLPTGADGVNRTNAAAANALAKVEPQLQPVFEQEIRNELNI